VAQEGVEDRSGPGSNGIGVLTTDVALAVRTWDAWLASATGIPAEAARGRSLLELIPDLEERGLSARFERVLSNGEVEILAPALHRYLIPCRVPGSQTSDPMRQRVTIGPLLDDGRVVGTIVVIEDVSQRVERERDLAARLASDDPQTRLQAAQLLSSIEPEADSEPLVGFLSDADWRVRRAAVDGLARRSTTAPIAAVLRALRDDHRDVSVLSSAVEVLATTAVDVLEPLLELLRQPDLDLRLQAALLLGERGDARAVPALIETLREPDDNLRFHVIEALGKLGAYGAVEDLAAIAESADFFLAFAALEALGRIGDPMVASRVAPLIRDQLLRGAAAEVLGRIGDEEVVAPLIGLLGESTAPTPVVADALARIHDRYEERYQDGEQIAELVRRSISATATQNLLDAIHDADADQLRSIATVLGWLEGPAVERALTRLLGQPAVRAKVVEYLVRHGDRMVDLLIEQLGAEDLDTRQAAVSGLGRIGDRRATAALLEVFRADAGLGVEVAGALARIGDPSAFDTLLSAIGHPDAAVRQAVVGALNSIGHPEMGGRIRSLLCDPDTAVRESAVRIAGYFGYRECADALVRCVGDSDAVVRRAAVEHLVYLDDERVVPLLIDALTDPAPIMRRAAAQALARLEGDTAVASLIEALSDADAWVRYFATHSLGERRRGDAVASLVRLAFDDPARHVQLAAIEALGAIADREALPALVKLATAQEVDLASAAITALGSIPHPDARPALDAALRAEDEERRAAAAQALAANSGEAAIEALEWTAGADRSDRVAEAAMRSLAALAEDGVPVRAVAESLVRLAADPARRPLVVTALASLPATAIEAIAQGLEDARPGVRVAVVQALARMRRAESSWWVERALDDPQLEVRLAALSELRHLGTRGIERKLVTLARTDPDATARRAALAVLRTSAGVGWVGHGSVSTIEDRPTAD
jgi:HEAT repeat protein